jgi:hypothetical protein
MKLRTATPAKRMRIKIKQLNTSVMEITEEGIELEFRESEASSPQIGDLIITPTKLIWNKGKTSKTGKQIRWLDFFSLMESRKS